MTIDRSLYMFPNDQPVVVLDSQKPFEDLNSQEKLYAHYLSQASWNGGLIVLVQTSFESPLIFSLLMKLFRSQSISELKDLAIKQSNFTEDEFQALLVYTSGVLTNMGNYKGFGDSKFVPNLTLEKFVDLVKNSKAYKNDSKLMQYLLDNCAKQIFYLDEQVKQLDFYGKGITTYFSSNATQEDSDFINKFMKSKNIEAYNSRVFKHDDPKGKYEIRLASIKSTSDEEEKNLLGTFEFEGKTVIITRGDYSQLLDLVNENLEKAKIYSSNNIEKNMLEEYLHSFRTGSLDAHKDGSRYWIKNKSPKIETYIGFIETYRDPAGQRGEFEGFVSMVNNAVSQKFSTLVENAEKFLTYLPWPKAFEKDTFLRPDFTSLDVLTFSGSGIPAGINIPNYDKIRQTEGFKNVSLGNVIPASYKEATITFLSKEDQELLQKYRVKSFEVQVGLHELLGHGSGKLFTKNANGIFNFDHDNVINPLTGGKISSWYEDGETYDSVFTTMGSSYEECRAECVGLFLCLKKDILQIFGFDGDEAEDIIYVNWLSLLLTALKGLEMYQPDVQKWGQAHSQARFVIMRVLLEAGQGLINVTKTVGADGKPDLLLTLDRSKINTVGKDAISAFLQKLQVYKSTADIKLASDMYLGYSKVSKDEPIPFYYYRDIVVARRQPRKMFVQPNTQIVDEDVVIKNYEPTHEGLIQSWIERYPTPKVDSLLIELWQKDKSFFTTE
uniref:Dipeptidyl peptidase 3 n=1 Tax=Hemiscolopendra marginata TaxID=943146 RepID=A0A646QCZ7_9MYRI